MAKKMDNLLLLGQLGTFSLLGVLILVLDIVAIASVVMGGGSIGHKLLWIVLILLLPVVGMILYFIFGRNTATV